MHCQILYSLLKDIEKLKKQSRTKVVQMCQHRGKYSIAAYQASAYYKGVKDAFQLVKDLQVKEN